MKIPGDKLHSINIREMRNEDLLFAAECTAAEGWVSENQTTLEDLFLNHPKGCLLAEENGIPVGICMATFYGRSGFIGELIVRPELRGRGVGTALLKHGVQLLKEQGAETVYLDGVVKAVQLYERNGFCKVCRSWRFTGTLTGLKSNHVRRMTMVDLDQVSALDQRSFGADRSYFLRRRLELFPELSYVMVDKERVVGFIFGRRGSDWVAAGPWIVEEIVEKPMELLQAFALDTRDIPINLGVLDTNQSAFKLIRSFGFIAHSDSPWRMALGSSADLGTSPRCFAIGSAAKG